MKTSKLIFKSTVSLFVLSIMLLSGALWPSAQSATIPGSTSTVAAFQASQKIKFPNISISITIGRASKGCRSFGICKITLGKLQAERTVRGELSQGEDGKLEITLLEKAPEEGRTLFVDQDIQLGADVTQKLGVKSATIQRGEYTFSASKSRLNARLTK